MTTQGISIEDVGEALRAGRPIRAHGPYRVQFGDQQLDFRPGVVNEAVPTGRQLLEAAGATPVIEHLVLQVLKDGLLDAVELEETVDLRSAGVEKFLVFRSDRSFEFELDGRRHPWGAPFISGLALKRLAGVDPVRYGVWQEIRGADDKKIEDSANADLTPAGVERFFTGVIKTTEG
jgi:hypothetical protein